MRSTSSDGRVLACAAMKVEVRLEKRRGERGGCNVDRAFADASARLLGAARVQPAARRDATQAPIKFTSNTPT